MEKYTIYCTEEQTKKAFELGAPLEIHIIPATIIKDNEKLVRDVYCIDEKYYVKPTAEQMIGWLEEQGLMFNITTNPFDEFKVIISKAGGYNNIVNIKWNKSRKEATLAGIDAALNYLIKAKEE